MRVDIFKNLFVTFLWTGATFAFFIQQETLRVLYKIEILSQAVYKQIYRIVSTSECLTGCGHELYQGQGFELICYIITSKSDCLNIVVCFLVKIEGKFTEVIYYRILFSKKAV